MTYFPCTLNWKVLWVEEVSWVKKKIAASIFVGSLLFGGISVGAAEVSGTSSKIELTEQKNKQRLKVLFAEIKLTKTRVQNVLTEVKPLQNSIKELIAKLKVAKEKKDKEQIKIVKESITKKQQTVKTKMTSIQPDLNRLKELQTELKIIQEQIKQNEEQNKVENIQNKQMKQNILSTKLQAKESKQQVTVEEAKVNLEEVTSLAEQVSKLKNEILLQNKFIGELLAK
jgi:hypothetical protein